MAHLCVPQNQALGVCRGFVPDIQICGTHGRKNLVNAAIISNAEEEEEEQVVCYVVRRDSSAVKFDGVEITFLLALYVLTDEGGEETEVPGEKTLTTRGDGF